MNFLFIHISPNDIGMKSHTKWVSQKIPHYAFIQMENTFKVNKGKCDIYLVCNPTEIEIYDYQYLKDYKIKVIDFNRISDNYIKEIVKLGKYCFDLDLVCLLKFPIMSYIMRTYSICEMMYQENDVAIFMDFENVRDYFSDVTVCGKTTDNAMLTGLFYCKDISKINKISEFIIECLGKHLNISDYSAINMFQDKTMELRVLPSIPSDTNGNILFDPASYGQYMAGNNQDNRTSFMDSNHRIVKEFLGKNKISIFKDNGVYKFMYQDKEYSLFDIHIHNKLAIERILK